MKDNKPSIKDMIKNRVDETGDRIASFFEPGMKILRKLWDIPMSNKYFSYVANHVQRWSMYYILILIFVFFAAFTNGDLLKPDQIILLIKNNVHIILLALPMTLVIISGNIDLSVGSILGFFGFVSLIFYNGVANQNLFLTMFLMILSGLALGMAHGLLIGYFRIPAFIITLGSMLVFAGARIAITNGTSLFPRSSSATYITGIIGSFPDYRIGNTFFIAAFIILISVTLILIGIRIYSYAKKIKLGIHHEHALIFWIKTCLYGLFGLGFSLYVALSSNGLAWYIIIAVIMVLIFVFMSKFTTYGRAVYSIGGNRKAAALSGIDPRKTNFITFSIMGVVTAIASVVFSAISNSAVASAGQGFELGAISSVFIGGASVWGGIGSITGTLIGTFILQIIDSGMQINSVAISIQNIIKGLILILAVGYDVFSHRKIK